MRAFLVDDEPLALKRLTRLLKATGRIDIVGAATNPVAALSMIRSEQPDVLFLDIQMPEMTGFDVLAQLDPQPLVVFTTAYDAYALRAFEVNSIDYLLKPIESASLERALRKLQRITAGAEPRPEMQQLMEQIRANLGKETTQWIERLPSRIGEHLEFVDAEQVIYFLADDKLTYAVTPSRKYVVDVTIQLLEQKLNPRQFVRIHRSTIVAMKYVRELHPMFSGRMRVRLRDERATELDVARNRVRLVKERMGVR